MPKLCKGLKHSYYMIEIKEPEPVHAFIFSGMNTGFYSWDRNIFMFEQSINIS